MLGFFKTRHSQEIEAMKLYDEAIDHLGWGDRSTGIHILEQNIDHFKEIEFYQPAADLAERVGMHLLAAQLYELNGDTERKPDTCTISKTASYENSIRLFTKAGFIESASRVTEKLDNAKKSIGTAARTGIFASLQHR